MTNYWGAGWTEPELQFVRDHPEMLPRELARHLPNRSLASCAQARFRLDGRKPPRQDAYAVKVPGNYVECLSSYLVEDLSCMEIWVRWNGYATWKVLGKDERGWVHLLCTAKG
jgi:hypothetical protein